MKMTDWQLYLYSTKNLITKRTVDNENMDEFLMNTDFHCKQRWHCNYKTIHHLNQFGRNINFDALGHKSISKHF